MRLICGDSLVELPKLDAESVDAVVVDPPYGLEFMGKEWDCLTRNCMTPQSDADKEWNETHSVKDDPGTKSGMPRRMRNRPDIGGSLKHGRQMQEWHQEWATAVLRVLKPGGYMLAFGGCYDAETDVLTRRGWVAFPEVTMEDEFISLDPATEKVEFQSPVEVVRLKHDGPMHRYRTNRVDLLVTPNHRMFVAPLGRSPDGQWRLVPSEDVPAACRMTKTSTGLLGARHELFVLPGVSRGKGHGHYEQMPDVTIPAETWAAFLGLWLAEGHASTSPGRRGGASTHVAITHFDKANVAEMVAMLSPHFKVKLYPGSGRLRINDPRLYAHFAPLGKAGTKRMPEYVKSWSPELLRTLLDWYARGDGDDEGRIYTASKALADDVQEVAMYAGLAADVSIRPPKDSAIHGRPLRANYPQYVIRLLSAQMKPEVYARCNRDAVKTVMSADEWNSGMVYCVELPRYHTLYVRRNGKAVWCGNTRTYHRLACAIEDAGFEIRDSILAVGTVPAFAWIHGQGFPKGKGCLKPAWEPILLGRRPGKRVEPLQIDACRVPGANPSIDRRASARQTGNAPGKPGKYGYTITNRITAERYCEEHPGESLGRWPANLVIQHHEGCRCVGTRLVKSGNAKEDRRPFGCDNDVPINPSQPHNGVHYGDANGLEEVEAWECHEDCPVRMLDEQSGERKSGGNGIKGKAGMPKFTGTYRQDGIEQQDRRGGYPGDTGGASRFFYCPKASRKDRDSGLENAKQMKLKDGLTPEQQSYVFEELRKAGVSL